VTFSKPSPLVLNLSHWWLLSIALFITLPLVLAIAFQNEVYAWYLERFVEPELQRDLGFTGGNLTVTVSGTAYRWYGVLSVVPGGVFDQAGVKACDRPVGYVHGARSGFISQLNAARGSRVMITFANQRDPAGTKGRETIIAVPRASP
jgi:hypothetical protein